MRTIMLSARKSGKATTYKRAYEIHKANGHPKGYNGPCWGPTMEELMQARKELSNE